MKELIKNDLIKKVNILEKEEFQKKSEENQLIDSKLFEVKKEIILYIINNRLEKQTRYG
ncbi:MAG: hypothetical protein PHY80_01330 [Rickettsiales bacterium]|nr:hypothetical protein [Rickettsiales bacterium]